MPSPGKNVDKATERPKKCLYFPLPTRRIRLPSLLRFRSRPLRRGLGGDPPAVGETEPGGGRCLHMGAEIYRSDLQNFQVRLNGVYYLAKRSPRRTMVTRGTLRASDQAQPESIRSEHGRNELREQRTLLRLIEDVETAEIEDEPERAVRERVVEEIAHRESTVEVRGAQL